MKNFEKATCDRIHLFWTQVWVLIENGGILTASSQFAKFIAPKIQSSSI
jgi:hypothetical protein